MASLYKKVISGKPYWYLREMGWVDGKPKMISERYVGTAADIEALLDAREEQMLPERTRHLDFGAVAAAWGLLADLGVAAIIDEETGARPPGLPLSPGTSQSEAEFSFRQMKDPHAVSFSPMFHWTEHNIRVHVLTCVLALQIAHLMRRQAQRAGLRMSVRELLTQLAGIGETILICPAARGRPKARRMLTETTGIQDKLSQVFQLDRQAPKVRS
jgi:hypothetical protein